MSHGLELSNDNSGIRIYIKFENELQMELR